jgi:hypothetical protein
MSSNSIFSFSDPFSSGIDFFTPDDYRTIATSIQIESNLVVQFQKTAFSSVQIDANSNASITITKIAFASANIICDGATLTLGTRIKLAECSISATSNLTVSAVKTALSQVAIQANSNLTTSLLKTALGSVLITAESNATVVATKIASGASVISATSNLTALARLIRFASSSISGNVNLTVAGDIILVTARIEIFNNTNITAQAIRFSNSITADFSLIRTLLMLDGVPLTNQNRQLDVAVAPVYIENNNWQGDTSRYYKNTSALAGGKRTFNLQWRFIPNYENKTVDLKASRNYIKKKSKDGDVHTLTIVKQDESGTTPYTEEAIDVFITNYSENLIRRDLIDDVYYFDCSLSLEEV